MGGATSVRLVIVLGLMVLSWPARAQTVSTGAIAGEVRDATGAVLPGVTVEAASPALIEKVRTVVTDGQGRYQIVELRPGTYTVTFTLAGFSTVKREGVELTAGFTAPVNADLRVGSITETITVSSASPVIDIQNVGTQTVLSRETLDSIPTNRTYYGMAALTVGATSAISGGGQDVGGSSGDAHGYITIHDSRISDGNTNWDGMTFNATYYTSGGYTKQYFINQAAVREVVLSTNTVSADTQTGGVNLNVVPKDGGNTFSVYFNTSYTGQDLQQSNLTDALRARGLTTGSSLKKVWDIGGGLGGPIMRDRLWFYTAHRSWGNHDYMPGNFYNKTPNTMFYTPDLTRQGYKDFYQRDHSLRLTWQAASKHKITLSDSIQKSCACHEWFRSVSPEAAVDYTYWPVYLAQATWSYPATNRLLFEAGVSYLHNMTAPHRQPDVRPGDISITELTRNFTYNAYASSNITAAYGEGDYFGQHNERVSMSYITGSHAFKVGLFTLSGPEQYRISEVQNAVSYQFSNAIPVSLTQWASPGSADQRIRLNLGLYGQDQWTVKRLTLNLGLRFDYLNAYVPAQTRLAGRFVRAFDFARIDNVPNWKDLSPRVGAAYDLFGDGRTALKVSLARYVVAFGTDIARAVNPANAIVGSATRTWSDANLNYVPDCDLTNTAANGECGGLSANGFGTVRISTRYATDVTEGFGVRPYNWQGAASIQQELRPGMALMAGYFRRWYGNFSVTQNLAVTAADFTPYCITAPLDPRLPGGGGNQICGNYDINPAAFGQVNNLVTLASNFGKQTEVYNGFDVSLSARFGKGGLLQGGVSTGQTVTDNCYQNAAPQLTAQGAVAGAPRSPAYCHVSLPWSAQTQFKASGVYPLPWDLQVAATYQNLAGFPDGASYVATNAQIAPSLGRNLGQCGTSATCNGTITISSLFPPNTIFEDRLSQLDLRFTKIVRMGRARVQGMFDIYNLFNTSTILSVNARYGPTWLQPTTILGARLFKFGAQFDF